MPTILTADDDYSGRRLIVQTLSLDNSNYRFLEAGNGTDALELAISAKPDLILLDIMMPEMSGLEVCHALKSREDTRAIPVILVTALKDSEDRIKGIGAGADDFLAKPFDLLELQLRVKSLLRVKLLHDELQRRYEELRAANDELRRLSQLKDDLTNMIIHDMRTPLSSIQLGIQFVLYSTPDLPETQRKTLDIAYTSMTQLTKMISDLLDINRLERGQPVLNKRPLILSQLVQQRFDELQTLAALDRKRFAAYIEPTLPTVEADGDLIARVFANLLSNALRYAPAGSEISVVADLLPGENVVRVGVHNEGKGIPREHHQVIFEKFHQLEAKKAASGQGVGLGLAFCKMAVEAHGGKIWVESEPDQGATFYFTLPLSPEETAPPSPQQQDVAA